MAKPPSMRHLYEINTAPQPPLVNAVLPEALIVELAPHFSGTLFLSGADTAKSHRAFLVVLSPSPLSLFFLPTLSGLIRR
jgi:hypothetical protein